MKYRVSQNSLPILKLNFRQTVKGKSISYFEESSYTSPVFIDTKKHRNPVTGHHGVIENVYVCQVIVRVIFRPIELTVAGGLFYLFNIPC